MKVHKSSFLPWSQAGSLFLYHFFINQKAGIQLAKLEPLVTGFPQGREMWTQSL